MNKYRVILSIISGFCLNTYSHTLEEVLIILTNNQAMEQLKRQAYKSLVLHELRSLMPENYFTQTIKNRKILTKIAEATITLAHEQGLFTLSNEQEYALLKTLYATQVIASREVQLSFKLGIVKRILAENQQMLHDVYRNNQQHAYTLLENCAERIYTEVIMPKTADKELRVDQEFYTTYKQAYKNAFIREKMKELKNACQ